MTQQVPSRPKISLEFELPTGGTAQRSRSEDISTFGTRVIKRVQKAIGDEASERVMSPIVNSYNRGQYETAFELLTKATTEFPELSEELAPHMRICSRVTSVLPNDSDRAYLDVISAWKAKPRLFKFFATKPVLYMRCKYCGHFTRYVNPDSGFAYMETNNCDNCDRGYPVPEFFWDSIDGQAYIYYRHSVTEEEFYTEFEMQFDVVQDHTYFLKKSK